MSQISSSHFPWSPNSAAFSPFPSSRALFQVSLNRLPTNPKLLFHTQPSLCNSLVAALKRAQGHQRRGCAEQQQSQQNQLFLAVTCRDFFHLPQSCSVPVLSFLSLSTALSQSLMHSSY
ncbi:hypothetical protein Bca4012_038752 [Brassica carinata]